MLPRSRLGGAICFVVFRLTCLISYSRLRFCIRSYGGDDDGIGTTGVRNSAQVLHHAAMFLPNKLLAGCCALFFDFLPCRPASLFLSNNFFFPFCFFFLSITFFSFFFTAKNLVYLVVLWLA